MAAFGPVADWLRHHGWVRPRGGDALAVCRSQRHRTTRYDQCHWTLLGRQSGLADPRWRRGFRGMAACLCHIVLGLLHCYVSCSCDAYPASGRVRVPQQGCRHALADLLGLCPVRWRAGAERGIRGGFRQLVARRSLPHRLRSAVSLRGKRTVRTAQSIRAAVRPRLRRNACYPWRGLSHAEDGWSGSAACARVRQNWRPAHRHPICLGRPVGMARNRGLRHHQHGDGRRAFESAHEDGRPPTGPMARQLRSASLDDRSA